MNLDLNYDEAIDFIIHLNELNLKHDDPEAFKGKVYHILTDFIWDTYGEIFPTLAKLNEPTYKTPSPDKIGFVLDSQEVLYFDLKKQTYPSDLIRTFLKNKSLFQRLQEEKKKEAIEKTSVSDNTASNVFSEAGRKGGKAKKRNEPLQKFIETFVEKNQSLNFASAWIIWKNSCKKTPYVFETAEINFTENSVTIDGKTLKKQTVKNYFYAAKKVSQ